MRARGRTVLVVLVGAMLVLSGCGGAPEEPASPFPPRPKNLDLSNVDLCATLTPEQKRERGIDEESESVATVDGQPAPTCNWADNENGDDYSVQVFQGSAGVSLRGTPGSRVTEISGFGAVRGPNDNPARTPGAPAFCQIPVDTSDNQSMRVQYGASGGDASEPTDHEAACSEAARLAMDILDNLTR